MIVKGKLECKIEYILRKSFFKRVQDQRVKSSPKKLVCKSTHFFLLNCPQDEEKDTTAAAKKEKEDKKRRPKTSDL